MKHITLHFIGRGLTIDEVSCSGWMLLQASEAAMGCEEVDALAAEEGERHLPHRAARHQTPHCLAHRRNLTPNSINQKSQSFNSIAQLESRRVRTLRHLLVRADEDRPDPGGGAAHHRGDPALTDPRPRHQPRLLQPAPAPAGLQFMH